MGVPKIRVSSIWGPDNKDPTGNILGSPIFEHSHILALELFLEVWLDLSQKPKSLNLILIVHVPLLYNRSSLILMCRTGKPFRPNHKLIHTYIISINTRRAYVHTMHTYIHLYIHAHVLQAGKYGAVFEAVEEPMKKLGCSSCDGLGFRG